ncbi:metal ABC transporter permease [Streptococcus suis]|uniref:metal ABC transporter permease n=1 Tax=Streptococcus suis TaxID=1307 RepID=UPI001C94E9D3|nr:metal ABC transporter permease [Streptococcus suis]MBY5009592.1 metal ABC transporter permease [Streptococcus suis]MDG4518452.1 metal ABC transporter permease [Streptococcus suis]HEM3624073.1 metal ABC transporter permease [Streptococcus suis]
MFEVLLILMVIASSCGLLGSILVVKNQSMLADALSHSVLLGIVLGFFISHSLDSPLLIVGASLFGLLSVLAIDRLHSRKIAYDAATGLVFSFFFAVAVLLISLFARNVHLDVDMVLQGEVLFAPLHRMDVLAWSLPVSLVKSSLAWLVIVLFFVWAYHRLQVYLFDSNHARLSGLRTRILEMVILILVSLTTVLAFEAIGSMTVIVFLVAPSMTALRWVKSFWQLLLLGQGISILTVVLGFLVASQLDLTMSGTCAVVSLLVVCSSMILKNTWSRSSDK